MYETVDARCGACVVKGGQESKCVSQEWEATIGKYLGRPCPRVELDPSLAPDVQILEFAMNERLRGMSALRAECVAQVYDMTAEEMNETLSRVSATLAHPHVSALIDPKVKV